MGVDGWGFDAWMYVWMGLCQQHWSRQRPTCMLLLMRESPPPTTQQTGDMSLNPDGSIVVMTTEILRNIMYRTAETAGRECFALLLGLCCPALVPCGGCGVCVHWVNSWAC